MTFLPWDYAIRNLGRSKERLAVAVGSACLVSLLILAAAGFVRGMTRSLATSGEERNALFIAKGSEESIERSEFPMGVATAAATLSGVRMSDGQPWISPEVYVQGLFWPGDKEHANNETKTQDEHRGVFRGVTSAAFLVHAGMRITEGRAPEPGRDEVMVGDQAAAASGARDADLRLGQKIWHAGRAWTVVGRFTAPGTVFAGEIWAPMQDMLVTTKRATLSSVTVAFVKPQDIAEAKALAAERNDLEVSAVAERDYYGRVSAFFAPVRLMTFAAALLIAAGGFFGGINTSYAAFAARVREFASLQAIGFTRSAIFASLLQESLVAAAAGGLLACAAGLFLFDGVSVRFSGSAFGLLVDGPTVAAGMLAALLLGVVGAVPPAVRCLRLPVATALRSA